MSFSMNKVITCTLLCLFIGMPSKVKAASVFTIAPYITVEDQGKITFNFQTSETTFLNINIKKNIETSGQESVKTINFSGNYTSETLNKLDLGTLKCDEGLNYSIASKAKIEMDNGLFSIPCSSEKPLYLGFMSDTQIKNGSGQIRANQLSKTVAELRKDYPFSLVINAGDIVQHGGLENEWLNFFNTANPYLSKSYVMAAVGNHEYFESPSMDKAPPQFLKYFRHMQEEDEKNLGYAALDLGRINIFMINSNFASMSEQKIEQQWDWLEGKLKQAEATKKPSIIAMHHAPFSSSFEYVREIPSRLRRDFVPMIEKYKNVKMVISGHLHMYERSYKNGISYLIAGPSGGINNVITYSNPYSQFTKSFVTTFSVFSVTSNKIEITTYTGDKTKLDQFSVPL